LKATVSYGSAANNKYWYSYLF